MFVVHLGDTHLEMSTLGESTKIFLKKSDFQYDNYGFEPQCIIYMVEQFHTQYKTSIVTLEYD